MGIRFISKRAGKKFLKGACLLAGLWILFMAALTCTAMIPRNAIRPALESNARYYSSADVFEIISGGWDGAMVHNYADAMLYNLIWSVDTSRPFTSVMTAPRYRGGKEESWDSPAKGLEAMVFQGREPDTSYGRYWHGTSVLLRPLSMVMDIHGIRILNALVLGGLAVVFGLLLWRRKLCAPLAGYVLAMVMCKTYAVPLCIEYVPCFVIMLAFGSILLLFYEKVRDWDLWFLASGAAVCFFDFLTCEILTLFVPLICLLYLRYKGQKGCRRACIYDIIRISLIWLAGYGLTFLCKWLVVSWITGQSLDNVALHMGMRRLAGNFYAQAPPGVSGTAGVTKPVTGWQGLDAVLVNLGRVWPMNLAPTAVYIGRTSAILVLVLITAWFLFRKKEGDKGLALPLLLIAFMPILRWMVVSNHSLGHPFFTFRDWFIIFMAVAGVLGESLDWSIFRPAAHAGGGDGKGEGSA